MIVITITSDIIAHAPCLLVSDDLTTEDYTSNIGVTLPNGANAIYDAGLSPLFFSRSGRANPHPDDLVVMWYGRIGYYRSQTARGSGITYRMGFHDVTLSPSYYDSARHALSLRCLVSTNNR